MVATKIRLWMRTQVKKSPYLQLKAVSFSMAFTISCMVCPILSVGFYVTIAAFLMLIILISGVITHKKDIHRIALSLRAFKGQRSYLDFHNVTSVIALPFFLTITFTGLAIFFYLILPNGMKKLYPEQPFQYFDEIRNISISSEAKPTPATMRPIEYFIQQSEQRWGKQKLAILR